MFFLSREWQDPEDGIEAVLLHWQATPLGQEPNWRRAHAQTMMTPQATSAPVRRRSTLWVTLPFTQKSLSKAKEQECPTGFLLHSFCEVIQRGRTWNTEVTSQEIRSVTVAHVDPSAECAQAMLYYSLDNLAHMNCVFMALEGLSPRTQMRGVAPEGKESDNALKARLRRTKRVAQLPLPHIFYGQIWGPVGARAFYSVYFHRDGAYNPFSERGFWLLRHGSLWEVTF